MFRIDSFSTEKVEEIGLAISAHTLYQYKYGTIWDTIHKRSISPGKTEKLGRRRQQDPNRALVVPGRSVLTIINLCTTIKCIDASQQVDSRESRYRM